MKTKMTSSSNHPFGRSAFAALLLALFCAITTGVHAATIPVTNTDDSGAGSLRAALAGAADGDTIDATGISGTIVLTNGQLLVSNSVTIVGPGPANLTVDGNYPNTTNRVFLVNSNLVVTITSLTISNGAATRGGGIYNDHSTVTVSNCTINGNSAEESGGGIYNDSFRRSATLTLANSTLNGNSAINAGGGILNQGRLGSATLTVSTSTLSGNSATNGGGIYNDGVDGNATVTVSNSTLSGNSAEESGGGIFNAGFSSGHATLTVSTSTLSGNSAGSAGGGIENFGPSGRATLKVNASTFSGNSAAGDGGGIDNFVAWMEIGDTILKRGALGANIDNESGTVISAGYNLSSDDSSLFLNQATDQNNTDPLLGPLQDNGGLTETHALLPFSPAIDKGKRDAIPALALNTDQRALPRPDDDPAIANAAGGDGSDIGAFEVQPPRADLLVSLGVDKTSVKQGEQLTYTITVHNFGPDAAANVVVNDTMSSGTTFVSAQANRGNFTTPAPNQTGVVTWNLGDLSNGDAEGAQLVVKVIVRGRTTITNAATASTASSDPNPANNSAAITVTVVPGSSGKRK